MPRPRSAKDAISELKTGAELLGLHLCESCLKANETCIKRFADENAKDPKDQLKTLTEDIKEIKMIISTTDKLMESISEQKNQIEELQKSLKELNKVSVKKLDENKQETKLWSSLFESKVETLITDIEKVQGSVTDTKSKIEINIERERRQNNIIVYNLTEDVGKSKEKELVSKLLKEVTGKKIEKEILEMFRIGKKVEDTSKPRPLLIKFDNLSTKNFILDNCYKLKESEQFRKVILNQDLSKEDREECKKLFDEKVKEINKKGGSSKWVVRIKGQPGAFHAVAYRRRSELN